MSAADDLIQVIADFPLPGASGGMELTISMLVQSSIIDWAEDLRRNENRVRRDAATAEEKPLTEEGLDALERALWSLGAARKSLLAVCFLALGVPTLIPGWVDKAKDTVKKGIQFELKAGLLGRKLKELEKKRPVAKELNELLLELSEQPAIGLRDEVTHSLAPLTKAVGLSYFEIFDGDHPRGGPVNFLWPRGMAAKKDISAATLWNDALALVKEADLLLARAIQAAASLLKEVGLVVKPQRVYIDPKSGSTT